MVKHYYLGNYPNEKTTGWCEDIEGVTHDNDNWFFTQSTADDEGLIFAGLWKFPVTHDLNEVVTGPDPSRGILLKFGMPAALSGYDHFGDLDHYKGFLFVPVSSGRSLVPRIAVFRANDLGYVGSTELTAYQDLAWCAIEPNGGILFTSHYDRINSGNPIRKYKIDMESLEVRGQVVLEEIGAFPIFDSSGLPMELTQVQGGTFSRVGNLYLLCGYCEDCDPNTHGIRVFDRSGRLIAASSNTEMPFKYEFHPGWSKYEEPEGITYWNLEDRRAPHIRGHLHALMLDNEWPGKDELYLKHYLVVDDFAIAIAALLLDAGPDIEASVGAWLDPLLLQD